MPNPLTEVIAKKKLQRKRKPRVKLPVVKVAQGLNLGLTQPGAPGPFRSMNMLLRRGTPTPQPVNPIMQAGTPPPRGQLLATPQTQPPQAQQSPQLPLSLAVDVGSTTMPQPPPVATQPRRGLVVTPPGAGTPGSITVPSAAPPPSSSTPTPVPPARPTAEASAPIPATPSASQPAWASRYSQQIERARSAGNLGEVRRLERMQAIEPPSPSMRHHRSYRRLMDAAQARRAGELAEAPRRQQATAQSLRRLAQRPIFDRMSRRYQGSGSPSVGTRRFGSHPRDMLPYKQSMVKAAQPPHMSTLAYADQIDPNTDLPPGTSPRAALSDYMARNPEQGSFELPSAPDARWRDLASNPARFLRGMSGALGGAVLGTNPIYHLQRRAGRPIGVDLPNPGDLFRRGVLDIGEAVGGGGLDATVSQETQLPGGGTWHTAPAQRSRVRDFMEDYYRRAGVGDYGTDRFSRMLGQAAQGGEEASWLALGSLLGAKPGLPITGPAQAAGAVGRAAGNVTGIRPAFNLSYGAMTKLPKARLMRPLGFMGAAGGWALGDQGFSRTLAALPEMASAVGMPFADRAQQERYYEQLAHRQRQAEQQALAQQFEERVQQEVAERTRRDPFADTGTSPLTAATAIGSTPAAPESSASASAPTADADPSTLQRLTDWYGKLPAAARYGIPAGAGALGLMALLNRRRKDDDEEREKQSADAFIDSCFDEGLLPDEAAALLQQMELAV